MRQKTLFVFSLCFFLAVSLLLLQGNNGGNAAFLAEANQSAGNTGHFGVTSHRATASELIALKNYAGTYNAADNYSQVFGGYGTGLQAPSEQQWTQMAADTEIVDNIAAASAVPSSVDQSKSPYFPPIANQGSQGSCVAWSLGYYTKTYQEAQEHNWNLSAAKWANSAPSVEFQGKIMSPAFVYNLQDNGKDDGLSYSNAVDLICNIGCSTYDKMPYNVSDYVSWPSEEAWTQAAYYRGDSSGIQYLQVNTDQGVANLKSWIASGHLATVSVDAGKFANLSRNDVWTTDSYTNPQVNHAGTVVGYDDNFNYTENGVTHFGAFKVANSWGVGGWENVTDGFYWISYEAMKQSVTYCMFYNDLASYTPTLFASFSISHPLRGECQIQIGVGNPKNATVLKNFYQYVSGGNYPFCSNKIVLDITEFKTLVGNVEGQSFYMAVYDSGTAATGTINSFAVNNASSTQTPLNTVNGGSVYVYASLPSPSPSPSPTMSPTPSASPTNSPSPTPTPAPTATPTLTPIPTATPSSTPVPTLTLTPKPTPTATPAPSETATPTPTVTPTQTTAPAYPAATPQPTTPAPTKTTPSNTPTNRQTPTPTNSSTPSPTTTIPVKTEDVQSTTDPYPFSVLAIASIVGATLVVGLVVFLKTSKRDGIRKSVQ